MSIETSLTELVEQIDSHPVYSNDYFDSLRNTQWTRETYALHRANFFYRTELTVKSIAQACARAAAEDDRATLVLFSYILNEECGNGAEKDCHEILMERAHNLLGSNAFSLDPLAVTAARNSSLIADGTNRYRSRMKDLCQGSYQRMLGVAMALENHAEKMLTHCRTAFRNHSACFSERQFTTEVEVYFNVHLDSGVESRHAADATACVARNCRTPHDLAEVSYGANEMLNTQLDMWQDLNRRTLQLVHANGERLAQHA